MCTLIALHRCVPGTPLVIAANRDEVLDRPAAGPALRAGAGRRAIAAPLDERGGGTWLGVNEAGVFAAITNRPGSRDESRRSRGLLVMEALTAGSAAEAAEQLERIPPGAYNGFQLFVADAEAAWAAVYADAPQVFRLEPGAHVIGNADPNDRSHPKVGRLMERVEALPGVRRARVLAALEVILRAHDGKDGPLADTCIHAGRYGTRSSTLLTLPGEERGSWRATDGPPCEAPYGDYDFLFTELGLGASPDPTISTRSM